MLGSGDYLPVAEASKALVAQAESHLSQFSSSTDHELPEVGQVRFIIMTFTGEFSVTAPEEELTSGEHSLSPLFVRAQNALSQLRLSSEKRRK
jgi:hypothetical protein